MAYSIDNKTVLSYGLFSWQQNGLIVWLIQLATKRPYYMAYSVDNKIGLIIWLIQLTTERSYYMADLIDSKTALLYGLFNWQ